MDLVAEGYQGPTPADLSQCLYCLRCFSTKRDLGVHSRSSHPVEYHKKALDDLKGKIDVKRRWAEVSRLAKEEAEIMRRLGPITNINEESKKKFPDCTIETIKGKRRPAKHKQMVLDIFGSLSPALPGSQAAVQAVAQWLLNISQLTLKAAGRRLLTRT